MGVAIPETDAELQAWVPELDLPVWERYPESTSANAQEVYPGVGDPMSFDVNLIAIEHGSRTFIEQAGLTKLMHLDERAEVGFYPAYYGRPHINIAAFREMVRFIPGGSPDAFDEQLFGLTRDSSPSAWKPSLREQAIRARTLLRLIPMVRRTPGDLTRNEETVQALLEETQSADLAAPSDADLMAMLDRALLRNLRTTEIHARVTLFSGSGLENLRAFLVKRDVPAVDAVVADLCTGLRDIESAKPGREISRLAATVRDNADLRHLFAGNPTAILHALRAAESGPARILRERLDRFLSTYGYRGVAELGLTTRVWAQRPESVVAMIKSQAERADAPNVDAETHEQEARREARTTEIEQTLNPLQRRRFRGLLAAAHRAIPAREQAKSQWARTTHIIRLLLLEAGRRLAERGSINVPEDVFMLRLADLRAAMQGQPPTDLHERIERWRITKETCERVQAIDERFTGRPRVRWRGDTPTTETHTSGTLHGIPVSPGRVTGPARVITELVNDPDLAPGEVLVCPFTDAAWTPLFFNASAVVMDLGGPLSHGATVAREYGLPAVANVKTGTRTITTGQLVTVDGSTGEVTWGVAE